MGAAIYGYVGLGVEAIAGTSVAPTAFLPVKSASFTVDQEEIKFREIAGNRQAQQSFGGSIRPSVSLTSALYPSKAYGLILYGLFGSVASVETATASGVFKHTFGDAVVLPSLSFERSDSAEAAEGILHERIPGSKIETVSFTADFGSDVEIQIDAQGLTFPEEPASKPAPETILLPAMNPFIFTGIGMSIDGTTSDLFKSVRFDFSNTLEPQETLRKSRNAYKIHEGGMECTLSGTMVFEDNTIYQMFRNQTEFSVTAEFTGQLISGSDYYTLRFTWPKVKVQNFEVTMEAEGVMEADVEFAVSYDRTIKRFVTVELINTDATIVAP